MRTHSHASPNGLARQFRSARWSALMVVTLLAAPWSRIVAPASATITIVNLDGPGEGFNDPTPAAPVGGNPGTTVGQQRLNLFQQAAGIWDAILGSTVEIRVQGAFDPLFCTSTTAVLGSAGPNEVESDFAGAGFAGTWYVSAEANRLAGVDLAPGVDDLSAEFNSNIGIGGCLVGRNWYYGYDGNEGTSGIDLLPVLLHEFGHGLGFLTLTDESDGSYFAGMPSIFDRYLMDDITGKHWIEMTPAERVASGINSSHLVWDGPAVTAVSGAHLGPRARVIATGAINATFAAIQANFGAPLTAGGFTAPVVVVNDGVGTGSDACESPFANAAAVAGKIALIDRGTCTITQKALNAQANGAVGILFVHNVAGTTGTWSAVAPSITIPIAGASLADGNAIRTALGSGAVTLTMGLDTAHRAGANDAGQVLMYAPNPDQPGSSVSHWDVTANPNLLMEPNINSDLTTDVDLTYNAFIDIGWFPQLIGVPSVPAVDLAFAHSPNPTREGGVLRFTLPAAGEAELSIFDVAGRRVAQLSKGRLEAGEHHVAWSRRDDQGHRVPAGIYLARLHAPGGDRTTHVVLVD